MFKLSLQFLDKINLDVAYLVVTFGSRLVRSLQLSLATA